MVEHSGVQGSLQIGLADAFLILDAVSDRGIVGLDTAGKVIYWGAGARTLFGYADGEVLGRPVAMLHADADRATDIVEAQLAQARESGRSEFQGWLARTGAQQFRAAGTSSGPTGTSCSPTPRPAGFSDTSVMSCSAERSKCF